MRSKRKKGQSHDGNGPERERDKQQQRELLLADLNVPKGAAALAVKAIGEAIADGSQGQLGPAGHIQLAEDVVEVLFHGTFTKAQAVGNFLVGLGFGNEGDDLLFAEGESMT